MTTTNFEKAVALKNAGKYKLAGKRLKAACKIDNNGRALFEMACILQIGGFGIKRNYIKADKYRNLSALAGYPLGMAVYVQHSCKDTAEYRYWVRKIHESGDANAIDIIENHAYFQSEFVQVYSCGTIILELRAKEKHHYSMMRLANKGQGKFKYVLSTFDSYALMSYILKCPNLSNYDNFLCGKVFSLERKPPALNRVMEFLIASKIDIYHQIIYKVRWCILTFILCRAFCKDVNLIIGKMVWKSRKKDIKKGIYAYTSSCDSSNPSFGT